MDLWTWTIIIGAISLILYYYYRKNHHDFREWGIPQPSEVPFLGIVLSNLIYRPHISDFMKRMYNLNKEAKYIGFHAFMTPIVVIRDLDLIKKVLVKDFDHFADHKLDLDESVEPLLTKNLSALNGEKWRETRNLLSPAFTSNKMKIMFELMSNCADNFTDTLLKLNMDKSETDIKEVFTKYTNDVIATCAFGIEVNSLKDPTNEFYAYGREAMNVDGYRALVQMLKLMIMQKCQKLAKILNVKLMPQKITDFFINIIDTAIKTRKEQGIERPDMLQLMITACENSKVKMDIVDMTAQAFVFFLAGFETTANHMCLVANEIACNPEILQKLHNEIDSVTQATNGKLTYEAVTNMPYLDAIFQEILRLHPQVAMLSRHCTKAYELPPTLPGAKPYLLKPDDTIFIPVTSIHKDPAYYENPEKFDPDRFIEKKVTSSDVVSLGFGLGPRMCIANRFAILETKVLMCHLLKKCTLEPCSKTCTPIKYSRYQFAPVPTEGFWLKIKER